MPKFFTITVSGQEIEVTQDDDGKFIIPEGLQETGTNLKPAVECWWLMRKPLSEKTVAANVLKHGTGGLNIDGCRINAGERPAREIDPKPTESNVYTGRGIDGEKVSLQGGSKAVGVTTQGRFPANLILTHHPDCEMVGEKKIIPLEGYRANPIGKQSDGNIVFTKKEVGSQKISYTDTNGQETVEDWNCHPECAIRILDEQSGDLHGHGSKRHSGSDKGIFNWGTANRLQTGGNSGGASRFFYKAKSAKKERNFGMPKGSKNTHITIKPLALMQYLIRLVTPPGGVVLDPFLGSGSTVMAAMLEDVNCLGCEKEDEYYEIAKQRCDYAFNHVDELRSLVDKVKKTKKKAKKKTKKKAEDKAPAE